MNALETLYLKYCDKKEDNQKLKKLISEAVKRLSMPIKQIRKDGFSELMTDLRKVNE